MTDYALRPPADDYSLYEHSTTTGGGSTTTGGRDGLVISPPGPSSATATKTAQAGLFKEDDPGLLYATPSLPQHLRYRRFPGARRPAKVRRIPILLQPLYHYYHEFRLLWLWGGGFLAMCWIAALVGPDPRQRVVRVAMIGNSMQYYNDLPRLLEAMAKGRLEQNSCLHGNADFASHLWYGNGMYNKWMTGQARIWDIQDYEIYDYGACSPQQLLFGIDERLVDYGRRRRAARRRAERLLEADEKGNNNNSKNYTSRNSTYNGDTYEASTNFTDDTLVYYADDDDYVYNITDDDAWEYGLEDDGTNPCLQSEEYNDYMEALYELNGRPRWDFVLINDNTRSPCCTDQREQGLELLETVYLPWIEQIRATPIFMVTYGYWAPSRDMSGLTDIPTFASLTYTGYKQYADLARANLPEELAPRIAPVGLAFLMVWEEDYSMWQDLMHNDEIHLSPSGTFLEACVVYATIFDGHLPDETIISGDEPPDYLWRWARRMAPPGHEYKPFPTRKVAQYLYHIAHRIVVLGETPKTLLPYTKNESVSFVPNDSDYPNYIEN